MPTCRRDQAHRPPALQKPYPVTGPYGVYARRGYIQHGSAVRAAIQAAPTGLLSVFSEGQGLSPPKRMVLFSVKC